MIECKNLGKTLANISWEFDGVTMDQFSKSTSKFVNVITIPEVDKQWSGRYVCVAVNEAGKAHKEVKGIYFDPPVVKPVTSPYMALKEGEDAVMSCSVIGKPNVTIVWFYNGNPLENSEKHQISTIGLSLKVQRLRKEDEGIYACEAIGIRGTKDSTKFEVRLGTPPKPRLIPYDTSLNLGEEGWFNCSAENETDIGHFPEMAVRTSWKRENGVPLDLMLEFQMREFIFALKKMLLVKWTMKWSYS
ncbi:lachesin-like [Hetaerina americana]|uniref:lachesin-like n=1 Tax=Hetaerina americana TaxID=62018 RepID=UPI003A7F2622